MLVSGLQIMYTLEEGQSHTSAHTNTYTYKQKNQ